MPPDPNIPSPDGQMESASPPPVPAMRPVPPPPVIGAELSSTSIPPPLPGKLPRKFSNQWLLIVLSLCLGLFLADGIVSLMDDTSILFFDTHALTGLRVIVFLLASLLAIIVYILMAITPMIPKRFFLPLTLFNVAAQLAVIPFYIYDYKHSQLTTWAISLVEVVFALGLLYWIQGRFKIRWPVVAENQLHTRRFSWLNLCLFLGLNLFVLLPAIGLYLWVCAGRAVDHFSDSFMALRPVGFTVQVRTYDRGDGKKIELVPMAHVAEPEFYRELSRSFPTNALILMEGVSDDQGLLTNKITYKRMATSLGLAEQQKEFKPRRERVVNADIDVAEFAPSTIDVLNVGMLIHTRGLNAETLSQVLQYSPPPHFDETLVQDLLRKRNRHLVQEIRSHLGQSEELIIPWGAAHMPEIAREIQKLGFHVSGTQEYVAIRFRSRGKGSKRAAAVDNSAPQD